MNEAMAAVTSGFISPSIRDADLNGIHINNGDTIGIIDKEIVVSEAVRLDAVKKLASILLNLEGKSMLTVFCGKDSEDAERAILSQIIESDYPSHEIYFIDGGQDIYPYIFVVE